MILQLLEVNDEKTTEVIEEAIFKSLVANRATISATKGGQLLVEKAIDQKGNFRKHYECNAVGKAESPAVKTEMKMETD